MCFSVNVNLVKEELENRFGATFLDPDKYSPSYYYHAFALPRLPAICSGKNDTIDLLRWGLIPSWVKNQTEASEIQFKTFNARAESVNTKPSFSVPFNSKRCIIPVKGFFEWQHVSGKKIPWYIYHHNNEIISLAGLWDEWTSNDTGEKISTFSIVTTDANELMAKIHNSAKRMPVILDRKNEQSWLDITYPKEKVIALLKPCSNEVLSAHTISDLINDKSRNRNTPGLISKYDWKTNGSLFSQ
jgi:putative SOS response-associated peptidase YedK